MSNLPFLKIFHWNCNYFLNKKEVLELEIQKLQPDIILLNEIKLDENRANYYLNFPAYVSIHRCRNIRGGGVAILIKKEIDFIQIYDLDLFNSEIVSIKINSKNSCLKKDIFLFSFYNPPSQKLNKSIFEFINQNYEHFIIAGDLNSRTSVIDSNTNENGKILENILENPSFLLINSNTPTFTIPNRGYTSVLDLIITSSNLGPYINDFSVLEDDLGSDHFPILLSLDLELYKTSYYNQPKFNFGRANWDFFKKILETSCVYPKIDNINLLNQVITTSIQKAAFQAIPKFALKKFRNSLPQKIVENIKERKRLKRKIKKNPGSLQLRIECNRLTNKIKFEITKFRNEQWEKLIQKFGPYPTSSRPFWRKINKFRKYNTDPEKGELFKELLVKTFSQENDPNFDLAFIEQ
ncbi:RNA-directed DNA polymerase from mobile element jockey-like, partial [Brachionus plicatilis]